MRCVALVQHSGGAPSGRDLAKNPEAYWFPRIDAVLPHIAEEETIVKRLLVIGGASSDVLHLEDRTVSSAGGAGMYTAMAARRCGAQVALFGPRPDPCPEPLKPVAGHLTEWLGPVIPPAQLPRFEISYRQGKTEYLKEAVALEE